jgi:phage-related protein
VAREIFVGSVAVGVVPDARGWNRTLQRELVPSSGQVGDEVGRTMSRHITDNMGKAGTESAGAFSDTFQKRLRAALEKLPKAKIDGDSTEVDRKVEAIRLKLEALSKKKIGIDMDASAAMKELAVLDGELKAIEHDAKNIDVRFNTVEARAQLALLKHQADKTGQDSGMSLGERMLGGIGMVGSGAGGPGASAGGGVLTSPFGIAVAGALGLFALPFIAEAASAGIVAAFGGALVGMAILGAKDSPKVQKAFTDLKDHATKDLKQIGVSFVPVLESILSTARKTMDKLTPVFAHAAQTISGPFKRFADTFISAFAQPDVQKSIQAVAVAFGKILDAITPQLASWIREFAQAITQIANVIAAHPEAFGKLVNFFVQLAVFILRALVVLTELATFMTGTFSRNIHSMADTWDHLVPQMQHAWSDFTNFLHKSWSDFINFFVVGGHNVEAHWNSVCGNIHGYWANTMNFFHKAWSDFINFFVVAGHNVEAHWNQVCGNIHAYWSNTVNFLHSIWSTFINFWVGTGHTIMSTWNTVCGFIHRAWSATVNAIHIAWSNTINFITSIMSRITAAWRTVTGFVSGAWDGAMSFIKKGVNTMYNVVHGVFGRILQAASWAFGWIPGIGPKLKAANAQFNGFRDQANSSLAGIKDKTVTVNVVQQMQQKVNATAAAQGRFMPGSVAGRLASGGIIPGGWGGGDRVPILAEPGEVMFPLWSAPIAYPLAASLGLPGFEDGGRIPMHNGGWVPSGASSVFGFSGRDFSVNLDSIPAQGGDGATYVAHFDGLTAAAIEAHVRSAFQAMSLQAGSLHRQGRRS